MTQRQIAHPSLRGLEEQREGLANGVANELNPAVRKHRPLRESGRARRVDQKRNVIHLHSVKPRVEIGVVDRIALRNQCSEGHHAWIGRAEVIHRHDVLDGALALRNRDVFVELSLIVTDHDLRLRIPDDVGHLLRQKSRVERRWNPLNRIDAMLTDHPVTPIGADDRDTLLGLQTKRHEPLPDPPHARPVLDPVDRRPAPIGAAFMKRGITRMGLGPPLDPRKHRSLQRHTSSHESCGRYSILRHMETLWH